MRISDWSSDVCSSDLDSTPSVLRTSTTRDGVRNTRYQQQFRGVPVYGEHVVVSEDANGQVRALFGRKIDGLAAELRAVAPDRKRVVSGKSVSVRVDRGGRRIIQKKKPIA